MAENVLSFLKRRRSLPSAAAVFFIFCLLLIVNFSNWRMTKLFQQSKEEDLKRRLRGVALVVSNSLRSPTPPTILTETARAGKPDSVGLLDEFSESERSDELTSRLQTLVQNTGLSQVILLTITGEVVSDTDYRFSVGEPLPFSIDQPWFEQAVKTGEGTTNLYVWEGQSFQRQYHRIDGAAGRPIGILMCSISADYVKSLAQIRTQVFRLWALSIVLLLILAFWFWRGFSYMVRLERKAAQATRVESMGALAAGVAHELRNPLAIIRVLAEEIRSEQETDSIEARNAQDIIQETQRLGNMINQFLSLSRAPESAAGISQNLNSEIERVVDLMRKSVTNELEIHLELPERNLHVSAEEPALRQVLLNLLLNAKDAVSNKPDGRITVSLKEKRNKTAELRIEDNGPGIPQKVLARVFEPFYTTKPDGTGLGLAISRGIAENLDGGLWLESSEDKGTVAILELPLEAIHEQS